MQNVIYPLPPYGGLLRTHTRIHAYTRTRIRMYIRTYVRDTLLGIYSVSLLAPERNDKKFELLTLVILLRCPCQIARHYVLWWREMQEKRLTLTRKLTKFYMPVCCYPPHPSPPTFRKNIPLLENLSRNPVTKLSNVSMN